MDTQTMLRSMACLIHVAVLTLQINRWEHEMRRASRNYQLCRTETAHRRLKELRQELEQLRGEMVSPETVERRTTQ